MTEARSGARNGAGARGERGTSTRGERGTSALVMTWWGLAMMGLALAVVAGGVDVATSHARARAAADAAALAGAGAHPLAGGDGDVCAAAERLAARNDAELADCRVTGHRAATLRVTVSAGVEPTLALVRRALGPMAADAAAGLAPAEPPATAGRTRPSDQTPALSEGAPSGRRIRGVGPSRPPRRRVDPAEGALRETPYGASGKRYDLRPPGRACAGAGHRPAYAGAAPMTDARADPSSADGAET